MNIDKEKLIILILRLFPIIFIIIVSSFFTYFIKANYHQNLQIDKKEIITKFINNNKNDVKINIETINNYIKNEFNSSRDTLKENIKGKVYNAHRIMTSIYNSYKDTKSKDEIKDLIKIALKDIRFNEGRGYFFIYKLDGTNIFHPFKPEREGNNFFDVKDINGTFIVRESIDIANSEKKEGFQKWFFQKMNKKEKEYEKIGFIKKFEPYNWFVGTGEYVENFESITKNEILNYLSLLKYINNRYVFVIDYEGNVLVNKNKKLLPNEIFKTKRLATFKKFILSTEKNKFLENKVKDSDKNEYAKISYLKKVDSLNFVIGLGFNLDIAKESIKNKTKELEDRYNNDLKKIFISAIIFTIILLIITYFLSKFFESLFKKYRNALNNKNLLLNRAQSQAKIGSWEQIYDDNNTINCSKETYYIFDIDVKEKMTLKLFMSRVHPEERDIVSSTFLKSVDEKTEYYLEHRLLFPNGKIKYVIERAEHFYNKDNTHISTLGTIQDITKRKEAEILLQQSEEQYKSLMQQSPYAIEIFDKNGFQISVNKAHSKLWGFDTSKTLGKFNILTDKKFKKSGLLSYIKRAYLGEIVDLPAHKFDPNTSTNIAKGEGRVRVIKSQIYPLKDINNNVKNIIITQIDISHEEEARKRDLMLTSVFQVLPDILFIIKNNGEIIDYRAQKNSDLYIAPETFLGKRVQDVLPKNIGEIFKKNISSLLKNSELEIFKYTLELNGKVSHFEARMVKLPLDGHIMTIIRDITKQENMKEDNLKQEKFLYQQSKMAAMGEMLGNIAHQWRQPLSTISTAATGAKLQKEMNCLSDTSLNTALTAINDSAQYLSTIIDDFRSFFNPSNNKTSEFLISGTIDKTMNLIKAQFTAKDIKLIKNIENISIFSIENELIQVLINILNNSRDALINTKQEKKYIFIDVYKIEDELIIEIKDNANGIPENIIDRVFEPYFTTKHKSLGTGIGLYMSEEIIKLHLNGTIMVKNDIYKYNNIEYKGAKFTINIKL